MWRTRAECCFELAGHSSNTCVFYSFPNLRITKFCKREKIRIFGIFSCLLGPCLIRPWLFNWKRLCDGQLCRWDFYLVFFWCGATVYECIQVGHSVPGLCHRRWGIGSLVGACDSLTLYLVMFGLGHCYRPVACRHRKPWFLEPKQLLHCWSSYARPPPAIMRLQGLS